MTPGWENVRIGLAESHRERPQWEAWRHPPFWYCLGLSAALWVLIFAVVFG